MAVVQGVAILAAELGRIERSSATSSKYGDYVDVYEDYGDVYEDYGDVYEDYGDVYEDAYADFPEYADHIIKT